MQALTWGGSLRGQPRLGPCGACPPAMGPSSPPSPQGCHAALPQGLGDGPAGRGPRVLHGCRPLTVLTRVRSTRLSFTVPSEVPRGGRESLANWKLLEGRTTSPGCILTAVAGKQVIGVYLVEGCVLETGSLAETKLCLSSVVSYRHPMCEAGSGTPVSPP